MTTPFVLLFGDRMRSARSARILPRASGCAVHVSNLSATELRARLVSGSVWLVRAGCWPVSLTTFVPPPSSETGRPLLALGALRATPGMPPTDDAERWRILQLECGGDFTHLENLPRCLPPLASVYLDTAAARILAARLGDAPDLDAALRSLFDPVSNRIVRVASLDVYDDPNLRIVQVVTSPQQGGAERIALDLARGLPQRGVSTLLITLGRATRTPFAIPPNTIDLSPLRDDRSARARAVTAAANAFGADLVHAHLLDADDVIRLAAHGLPLVLTIHNTRSGWPQGLETLKCEHAVFLIACASAVERELHGSALPIPMRTIWNGIDFTAYEYTPGLLAAAAELRRGLGIAPEDYVLISVANPRPQKRLDRLPAVLAATQSFLHASGRTQRVHLLLAGSASSVNESARHCEAAVRAEVERLGLQDCVHWLGAVDPVAPVLAASNVLVSTSAYEGLSLAHLEALAAGLPLVATAVGGTPEIAHHSGAVTLLPANASADQFATSIIPLLLRDKREFLNRDETARHFSRERMIERHVWLYPRIAALLARRPRSGLLLVTNNFTTGGAQSSARRLLAGLAAQGVPVRAAVLEEDGEHLTPGCQRVIETGIPVHVLPRAGSVDPAVAVAELLAQLDAAPPEVVLLWNVIPEYKLLLADGLLDVPLFDVSPGEMYFASLERYFRQPRSGLPYLTTLDYGQRLSGVIVKYQAEADLARRILGCPIHVIPNGVPLDAPTVASRRQERLIFGTAARLSPQKKLEDLLAAFRRAHERLPPYVLRIAGGIERGAEEYAAELHQLADGLCVEWFGELPNSGDFLQDLDVFVMISEPAGCPNASLEAMAVGLPVIATDVGGAAEQVIDGVTGRLTPRNNADALAGALVELAENREKRAAFGRSGRQRAEHFFDVQRMVADYRRILSLNLSDPRVEPR